MQVLPQESFLFSDSLAANLRLAAAEDVLERLPQGLDTPLGDRGVSLSGGQRQRLCLARALLGAPNILCLDDATSALDAHNERRVLDNLRYQQGRAPTLLLITSRLSTLLLADRVLLLEGGRISASGRHAELATYNAHYRELLGIEHG